METPRDIRSQPAVSWRRGSVAALLLALAVFAFALAAFDIFSHDVWWHVASGEWILQHGAVPRTDPFTSTVAETEWVDHEWASQALLAVVDRATGAAGLVGVRILFVLAIAAVLVWALRRRDAPPLAVALLVAVALKAAQLRLQIRPELVSLLLATALIGYCMGRRWSGKTLLLALVAVPWVMLHGGFLIGLAILACHAGGGLADRWVAHWRPSMPGADDLRFRWLLLGAAALLTLANPLGLQVYSVLGRIHHAVTVSGLYNPEWSAPYLSQQPLFFGLAAVLAVLMVASLRNLSLSTMAIGLLLLVYSLRFARGTAFLSLAFPILAWECLRPVIAAPDGWLGRAGRALTTGRRGEVLAAALLLTAAAAELSSGFPRFGFGIDARFEPVWAAEFVARERPGGALYNEIGDGGYLIWRLHPDYPVFLDGRIELFGELLPQWSAAQADPERWNRFLSEHRVRTAVVRPAPARRGAASEPIGPLTRELFDPARWALVHFDDHNLIYLRRDAGHRDLISRLEYRCVHPESLRQLVAAALVDPDAAACLQTELERRLNEEPPSTLVEELSRRLATAAAEHVRVAPAE